MTTENPITFSILITTKNRLSDLLYTLSKTESLLQRNDVECIICDDGSTDATSDTIRVKYPEIALIRNDISIGLIGSRNKLLSIARGEYSISLDDDAHFLSEHPLENIERTFKKHSTCGVVAFRIFWGTEEPTHTLSNETEERVKGFIGCGHAWNMNAWRTIPNYPEWFIFYGEEDFASYHLFKHNWQIHYVPDILVHHRVDLTSRRTNNDYQIRMRRSLRAGWYLMFLFYPVKFIPKRWLYSLWVQIKKRTLKGNIPGTFAILQALGDLILNLPRILLNSKRFSSREFELYNKLPDAKIYWKPESEQH